MTPEVIDTTLEVVEEIQSCDCSAVVAKLDELLIVLQSQVDILNGSQGLLLRIYTWQLYFIGILVAVFVCVLLYKSLRTLF